MLKIKAFYASVRKHSLSAQMGVREVTLVSSLFLNNKYSVCDEFAHFSLCRCRTKINTYCYCVCCCCCCCFRFPLELHSTSYIIISTVLFSYFFFVLSFSEFFESITFSIFSVTLPLFTHWFPVSMHTHNFCFFVFIFFCFKGCLMF